MIYKNYDIKQKNNIFIIYINIMDKTKSFHEIDTNQKYLTKINDYNKNKKNILRYYYRYYE